MNIEIWLQGWNVTEAVKLDETRLSYDSSRRITTGSITIMAMAPAAVDSLGMVLTDGTSLENLFRRKRYPGPRIHEMSEYDRAIYDEDRYELLLSELYSVTIFDGRDHVTKLFEGAIFAIDLKQSDANDFETFYVCSISDYSVWLDRAVCWDRSLPMPSPASDATIIQTLIGAFCPQIDATQHVAQIIPALVAYDWYGKTCRQMLDDMATLSLAVWHVDFEGVLWYETAAAAPAAPFALSTSPDNVSTFPVRVDSWRRDFTNPVNHAYVRGALQATGVPIEADYLDQPSINKYGEFSYSVIDDQITDVIDAELRARTTVLKYAQPLEQGQLTIWKDGLAVGQRVHITEENLGIEGDFTILSLAMQWHDQSLVEYQASFGAARPDLETYLRLIDQRARWKTATPQAGTPVDGSVSDSSIVSGGLTADVIQSVNAGSIVGSINAGQIGSINASQIVGQITAGQIGSVYATVIAGQISAAQIASVSAGVIQGSITAGQIGSVNAPVIQGAISAGQIGSVSATTIQGVIITSQLGNQIVDDLAKYADALRPVRTTSVVPSGLPSDNWPPNSFFYYEPDGHFYQMNSAGTSWAVNDNPSGTLMSFFSIGKISATSIIGAILAGQIGSVNASSIVGLIQAAQIGSVNASAINGAITATQITSVAASSITGSISAAQIGSVNATSITGLIQAAQINTITAAQINTTIQGSQIANINGATIIISTVADSAIINMSGGKITAGSITSDKLNASQISVGGGGNMTAQINVYDNTSALVGQIGSLSSSGNWGVWAKVFGAGGTGYSDAKIKSDTAGNLSIVNAALTITASDNSRVRSSPVTYGTSYASIALVVDSGLEQTEHISRGIVMFYNSAQVCALVRHPSQANAGTMTIYGAGTLVILADGSNGTVRANGGFLVGSNVGITQVANFPNGSGLSFAGGICYGYTAPTFTPLTKQLNIPIFGSTTAWYECYFTNGLLGAVIQHP